MRPYSAPRGQNTEKNGVPDLDRIDHKILAELMDDARASQLELSEKVGLSPAAGPGPHGEIVRIPLR